MSRLAFTARTRLVTGALGFATLCCGATACGPAGDASPNDSGAAGTSSPGGKGVGGNGPGGSGSGSLVGGAATSGSGGALGGNAGGPTSGGSGGSPGTTGGTGGSNPGTSGAGGSSGGNGGSGGSAPIVVPPDPALMSRCTGSKPIKCTIVVPANGNYNVTVELGSAQAASSSQVEAELARIVVPTVKLAAGAYSQHTFSVNVRDEIHDD